MAINDLRVDASAAGDGKVLASTHSSLTDAEHRRLQEALRAGRTATFDWDMGQNVVVRSANAEEVFGPGAGRETGEGFLSRVPAADREGLTQTIGSLTPGQPDYVASYRYVRPSDGCEVVAEDTGRAEFDEAGRLVRLLGVTRDITQQRQAEESQAALRALLDHNPSLVFMKDEAGRYVYLNAAYEKQFVRAKDWLGKTDFALWPRESAELFRKDDAEVLRSGQMKQFLEDSQDLEGKRHCWLCYKFPFTGSDGKRYVGGVGIDATRQVEMEEKLRESEERLRSYFELGLVGMAITSPTKGWLEVNAEVCGILGYERSELMQKTWAELTHPDDLAANVAQFNRILAGEIDGYSLEKRFLRKGGEVVDALLSVRCLRRPDHSVNYLVVLLQDITERKRIEQELRQTNERLRKILAVDAVGVMFWDLTTGRMTDANDTFLKMMGYSRGEVEAGELTWQKLTPPEYFEVSQAEVRKFMATGRVGPYEKEYIRKDGTKRWLLFSGSALGAHECVEFCVDIAALKRAEAALQESERRFRTMADGTPLMIWVSDANGDNRYVNRAYLEFFGVKAEEVEGQKWQPLVHPDDRAGYVGAISRATQEHAPLRTQLRVKRHDGAWRWIESCAEPRFSTSGEFLGMAACCPDITEQKEFEAELQRLVAERTAKLQELVGELEHFSYTITHDLKSPLRAMRGFAEIAGKLCQRPEVKEWLGRITTSAERMDRLIADALNYSRTVRQELPLDDVDAGALLRGMLDSYPEFQPDKARIRVEGRLPVVLANAAGLTQVFSNLLGNAVKFVKAGQKPDIKVWAQEVPSGRVRVWVEDQGIGISEEMLPRVFEMFARASQEYEGTGIGLALVRKVVQRMGGKVGVESEEGRGSRFWFELAQSQGEAIFVPELRQPSWASAGQGTVLYVEDEESDALFMERAFAEKGIQQKLRRVGTGRSAIDYLSGSGQFGDREKYPVPAVVLLDLNLPQISGFGVLEWIRSHPDYGRLPVVIFSSSTREDDRVRARELGANEFVAKPSSGLEFGEVVEGLQRKWLGAGGG